MLNLRIKELGKKKLIPSILEARQAPVHTVGIAHGVSQLLWSEWTPLLLVNGGVCISAITGKLCDVQKCNGHFGFPQHLPYHFHYALSTI